MTEKINRHIRQSGPYIADAWDDMSRTEKEAMLAAVDVSTDPNWLRDCVDDIRSLRKEAVTV